MKNAQRAIITGTIVTIQNGKRVVKQYRSGQKLVGRIMDDDAPPFTGYVRGWFKQQKGTGSR